MVITKQQMAQLPIEVFDGDIEVVDSIEKIEAACRVLSQSTIIGFDTETRPAFQKGVSHKVALLQLSTDKKCFLFRLNKIGISDAVMDLLCDEKIKVIGLSLKDDFAAMRSLTPFRPINFVELQTLVKKYGIQDISLQKIYAILFGKRITKNQRLTNWEADALTDAQRMYAAIDAWACVRIYKELMTREPQTERE